MSRQTRASVTLKRNCKRRGIVLVSFLRQEQAGWTQIRGVMTAEARDNCLNARNKAVTIRVGHYFSGFIWSQVEWRQKPHGGEVAVTGAEERHLWIVITRFCFLVGTKTSDYSLVDHSLR